MTSSAGSKADNSLPSQGCCGRTGKCPDDNNGVEFCRHGKISDALKMTVYFADSCASCQKCVIENMNKLIRQYIPKGTDFNELTDGFIHSIRLKINRRPRKN